MAYPVETVASIRQRIERIRAALADIDSRLSTLEATAVTVAADIAALQAFDATLGTMAFQDSNAVTITGGSITNIAARWG